MPVLLHLLLSVHQELLLPAGGADVTPHQERGTSKKSPCADKDRLSERKMMAACCCHGDHSASDPKRLVSETKNYALENKKNSYRSVRF